VNYVALGDSYSAGHGVPPYDRGTAVGKPGPAQDLCHRSRYAYSRELSLSRITLRRSFFACAGAQTADVTSRVQWPGERVVQLGHTAELASADLVTLTIGGNDVRFDLILGACSIAQGSCSKPGERAAILAKATSLEPTLIATFSALRAAAPPTAAVLVADYPQLFPAGGLPGRCQPDTTLFKREVQRFLRHAAFVLRATIADAAHRAGVQFVDVMPIFSGHEICGKDGGWMNHLQLRPSGGFPPIGAGENSVHPNRTGQAGYARAIADYIHGRIAAHAQLTPAGLPANPPPAG
jgi:lysophospholipase L1-like esterase